MSTTLRPNQLAFIALANEYCHLVENARETVPSDFVAGAVRLLPRIYISAADLSSESPETEETYIADVLTEDYYESVRMAMEMLLGSEDTFLEVVEENMKYSDTPIGASISELLSDIFQVLYNFLETVRDAPDEVIEGALVAIKEDFESYWSQKLCNVMRPLNNIRYSGALETDL